MTDTGFLRPELTQLIDRVESDFNTRIPSVDSRLPVSFINVLARALGGSAHSLHGHLDWISRQAIVDTAESDYLERWASIWGVSRKPAFSASGKIALTGTVGYEVVPGGLLQRSDGVQFELTQSVTLGSGTTLVNANCLTSGITGNSNPGVLLNFVSPIPGVNTQASINTMTGGADIETDESLLNRLLSRIRQPPHGGAYSDYVNWALTVPGVTRAWAYANEQGPGTVTVRFMMDDSYSNGIPLPGDITGVQNVINPLRPVTASVYVAAPIAQPVNFQIQLIGISSIDVKNAITAELTDLIYRECVPGNTSGTEGTLLLSHIREAISTSAGEYDHALVSPTANVTTTPGNIITMGSVTWV
jgi:uncharacterized phage protein gp47/JayE